MNKIKSFLIACVLLITTFVMLVLASLVYRANEQSGIKTYIFQTNNYAKERVGELQNIQDISTIDLRNKLIKKYVSEYFKVVPGETNVSNRPVLKAMSEPSVFNQWENGEAKTIEDMSAKKMFRMVRVNDSDIALVTNTNDIDYRISTSAKKYYYAVRYTLYTWSESNIMAIQPSFEQGIIYIEARFKPGINPEINVQKHLEKGKNPAGMFMFIVTSIGSKENI